MKSLILLASLFLVSESFAEALPTCRIDSLKHAELCMKKVAKFMPEYEEPNEGVVSLQKESMVKVLKAIGEKRSQNEQCRSRQHDNSSA